MEKTIETTYKWYRIEKPDADAQIDLCDFSAKVIAKNDSEFTEYKNTLDSLSEQIYAAISCYPNEIITRIEVWNNQKVYPKKASITDFTRWFLNDKSIESIDDYIKLIKIKEIKYCEVELFSDIFRLTAKYLATKYENIRYIEPIDFNKEINNYLCGGEIEMNTYYSQAEI